MEKRLRNGRERVLLERAFFFERRSPVLTTPTHLDYDASMLDEDPSLDDLLAQLASVQATGPAKV